MKYTLINRIGIILGLVLILIGTICKIQQWPNFYELRVAGLVFISVFSITLYFFLKNRQLDNFAVLMITLSWTIFTYLKISTLPLSYIALITLFCSIILWTITAGKKLIKNMIKKKNWINIIVVLMAILLPVSVFIIFKLGQNTWFSVGLIALWVLLIKNKAVHNIRLAKEP